MEEDKEKEIPVIDFDKVIMQSLRGGDGKTNFLMNHHFDKLFKNGIPKENVAIVMTFEMEPTILERRMIEATKNAPQRLLEASMIPADRMTKPGGIIETHFGTK